MAALINIEEFLKYAEIPSLPEVISRLYELVNREVSASEFTHNLALDPGLTARTLQLANSAWYKRSSEITELNEAVSLLGIETIYQLVFSAAVSRIFSGIPAELVDMNKFWRQSYLMASYAYTLANKVDRSEALPCFTAGLMTYLGKLLIYTTEPDISRNILNTVKQKQMPQYQVENFFLGFNHADVCAAILQNWQFPSSLYLPIKYYPVPHHAVARKDLRTSVLHIAHYMQYTYASNVGITDPPSKISTHTLELTGIRETELSVLAASAQDKYQTAVAVLKL